MILNDVMIIVLVHYTIKRFVLFGMNSYYTYRSNSYGTGPRKHGVDTVQFIMVRSIGTIVPSSLPIPWSGSEIVAATAHVFFVVLIAWFSSLA